MKEVFIFYYFVCSISAEGTWGRKFGHAISLFEVTENNTWINPFVIWDVSIDTLVKERIIQFCVFINDVREKWSELCIYYFATTISNCCLTPVQVPLTGLYPGLKFFIPLLSGYFCQQILWFLKTKKKKIKQQVTSVIALQWLLSAKKKPKSRSRFSQWGIFWNWECLTEIAK